jgi:hypothetical protein
MKPPEALSYHRGASGATSLAAAGSMREMACLRLLSVQGTLRGQEPNLLQPQTRHQTRDLERVVCGPTVRFVVLSQQNCCITLRVQW